MNRSVDCPVDTCSFAGPVSDVADHVTESDDAEEEHTWETLEFENAEDFCYHAHLQKSQRLRDTAKQARDQGDYDVAIDKLEGALNHLQRAKLFTDATLPIEDQCREVLETIDTVETTAQQQVIDECVNEAENAIDDGDAAHFEGDTDSAAQAYDAAVDALNEAKTHATELDPDRVPALEQTLRRVRVRQQSLELSEAHETIRDLVAEARDFAAAGDRAFHESEYERAVSEYDKAKERYDSLADIYYQFSFDEPATDPNVCDVCGKRFDEALDWEIEFKETLRVCPSCARFGSDGNLPRPRDVATEHRAVVENIESIRDGEVGVTWTSDSTAQPDKPEADKTSTDNRNTQQMLIQLVGLYQQLGRPPTAEEIDAHTDFGFLAYRDEFGSISDALQAAGFDS